MKKSLLLLFFSLSFTQIIAQSSVILPNGNVIPSFTLANRPATNQTVGQLIYQIDGTSGLYVWSGTAWTAVSAGSSGSGTITNVTASAPISVVNGTTTPVLSISQANSTTNGFLSSTDWSIFSNKGSFNLPSLTDGSILFSNGTTIRENNNAFKWNNSNQRLDVKGLNDGSIGAGYNNWISTSIGGSGGNKIVMGVQHGDATIGAHIDGLNGWAKLAINPGGTTSIGSLTGIGTRMVVANATGDLSTQAIPTFNAGSVLFSDGSTINQNNSKYFWNNTTNLLGIGTNTPNRTLTVNSTNDGTGDYDWISGNFGGTNGDRVVIGILNGTATIGSHNNSLSEWRKLSINPIANNNSIILSGDANTINPPSFTLVDNFGATTYQHVSPVIVNGTIRQATYTANVSITNNSAIIIWKHNLGYQPIIMQSLEVVSGTDLISTNYVHIDNNSLRMNVFHTDPSAGTIIDWTGKLHWIVVR